MTDEELIAEAKRRYKIGDKVNFAHVLYKDSYFTITTSKFVVFMENIYSVDTNSQYLYSYNTSTTNNLSLSRIVYDKIHNNWSEILSDDKPIKETNSIDYSKFKFRIGDEVEFKYSNKIYQGVIVAYYFGKRFNTHVNSYGYTISFKEGCHDGEFYSYNDIGNEYVHPSATCCYIVESAVLKCINSSKYPITTKKTNTVSIDTTKFRYKVEDEWNHPKVESKIFKSVLGYKEVPSDVLTTTFNIAPIISNLTKSELIKSDEYKSYSSLINKPLKIFKHERKLIYQTSNCSSKRRER